LNETGGTTVHIKLDVTSEADWLVAMAACAKLADASGLKGRPDIVVNNAGTTYKNKPTLDVTAEEFDRVFNVNVRSIFLGVKAVVPVMKETGGGSIINISSIGTVRPRPGK
jgi:NAD(P)-dependent dehydrogenase (short-subunit alcohol dehydrogenase family)